MSGEAAQEVLDTSVDSAGLSIVSATQTAENPRNGSMYDPVNLAAGVPMWFHALQDGRYLALFQSRWTAATVGTGGPHSYTTHTETPEPTWVTVTPATGVTSSLGKIPSRLPGTLVLNGAVSSTDYLFTVGSLDMDGMVSGIVQHHRVTSEGTLLLAGEELLFPVPAQPEPESGTEAWDAWRKWKDAHPLYPLNGVLFDKGCYLEGDQKLHHLVLFGTDDAGNVYQARRRWARIGSPDPTPGYVWEYRGAKGWLTDISTLEPIGITSLGPVSVAKFKDRLLVSTVEAKNTSPNLVISPGFEDPSIFRDFNTWPNPDTDGSVVYSTEQAHGGTHSLKLTQATSNPPDGTDMWCYMMPHANDTVEATDLAQGISVTPGQRFYMEAWVYPKATNNVSTYYSAVIATQVSDSHGVNPVMWLVFGEELPTPTLGQWTKVSGYVTIPDGYDTIFPYIENWNDGGFQNVYYWDDVVFREERPDYSAAVYTARAADKFGTWKRAGSPIPLGDPDTYLGGGLYFQSQLSRNQKVPLPAGVVVGIPYLHSTRVIAGSEESVDTTWGLWPI